jgi:class 3 adenylate cyclase
MVMVVGDIISFSNISEHTDERVLLESIDALYAELLRLLSRHGGTLSNYAGDAFFATWELGSVGAAATEAVSFVLESIERIRKFTPSLPLRDPSGMPLRMGWGISSGNAAASLVTGMFVTVVGDATNVAFRLSSMAGRGGWSDAVVTEAVRAMTLGMFGFTEASEVAVKGRAGSVTVYGVTALG